MSIYKFDSYRGYSDVEAFFTNRFLPKRKDSQWDFLGDGRAESIRVLKESLDCSDYVLVLPEQAHSDVVIEIDESLNDGDLIGDALITNQKGIILGVLTADCVPLVIYCPKTKSIGVVHAGWQGTLKNIAGRTISEMSQRFGVDVGQLVIAIGPSIRRCCFEVKEDLISKFHKKYPDVEVFHGENGANFLDLIQVNKRQLLQMGVSPELIEVSPFCTVCHNRQFFSYRKDNSIGRFLTGIYLKK